MQVRLASGAMTPPARVVGVFAPDDLAVIRVEGRARELHPASLGKSAAARVGERDCAGHLATRSQRRDDLDATPGSRWPLVPRVVIPGSPGYGPRAASFRVRPVR
jgi:hypothetical protein